MVPGPNDPAGGRRRSPARTALAAAGLAVVVVAAVAVARSADPAAAPLPAVGTYDLSDLPLPDRSSTTDAGVRVTAEAVLVTRDEVRLGLSWTGVGGAPTTWGCDGASAPAGRWWATPAGPDGSRAWSPQTGALCRTVDDVTVLQLEPGASAADFHRFPRDATWSSGPVRVVAHDLAGGVTDPRDDREPDVDLVVDLGAVDPT